MNIKQYFESYHGLQAENRWNRLVTLGLVVLCLGETTMLAIRPTVVTIQPWTLTRDAQVTESDASQNYIEAWGLALSELLGNVTPANVDFIADRLGPLLDPKIYHQVIDAVHANAEELRNDRVTMRFEPRRVNFEKSTGKVYVTGRSYVRQGTSLESEKSSERTYEFTIRIANYAPVITHIDTYKGTAQTADVEQREKARERSEKERQKKNFEKHRNERASVADLVEENKSGAVIQ